MWRGFVLFGLTVGLPPMRWDISSCLDSKIRAEDDTKIIVSQSFPNPIARGWSCEYKIYSTNPSDKILIEFQHFSMTSCNLQNFTMIDDGTGRSAGPYCNTYMPPVFVSDTGAITIQSLTGETDDQMDTEGYMFTYKKVDSDYRAAPAAPDYGQFNFMNPGGIPGGVPGGIPGGRPAYPAYGSPGGRRPLPPSAFGLQPPGLPVGMNPGIPQNPIAPNGVPVFGPSGQQTTVYNMGNGAPEYHPFAPSAPEVKSNLPGGQTEYIQPNYEKNQEERLLIDTEYEDDSGWKWTIPKIIGIAAGGLCITAVVAAVIQYQLRKREKRIAKELRERDNGSSSSDTSFTSFDSAEEDRERKRQKRRKKRKSPEVARKKEARPRKDPKTVTQTEFTEKTLKNAERTIELQKLQKKLMKYT